MAQPLRSISPCDAGPVAVKHRFYKSSVISSRPGNRSLIRSHGYFRLFLGHVSAHKSADAYLKSELQLRAISVFVVHEDIVPSSKWQNQIELALWSMHTLTALLTLDFHPSNRTDQETGFVLGRDNLVTPICLGSDPYGFTGKVQGLAGSLEESSRCKVAGRTLRHQPKDRAQMEEPRLCQGCPDGDRRLPAHRS